MATLTSANTIFTLSVVGLFDAPQQLQGFAADDITDIDIRDVAETLMGVDGFLSGGLVKTPVMQSISLQADSASNFIFDQWVSASNVINDIYYANGIILLPSLDTKYTLTRGVLTKYPPIASIKKMLQPRRYSVVWESVSASPL